MFCGSFFSLLNCYYLLYGIYEHTLNRNTRIQQNSRKQYVLVLLLRE